VIAQIAGGVITLALLVVLGRVAMLQVAPDARLRQALAQHKVVERFEAPRGDILDRRGRVLAATRIADRMFMDPAMLPIDATLPKRIAQLADAIGADPDELAGRVLATISRSVNNFHDTGRFMRYATLSGPLSREQAAAVRAMAIPGIHLESHPIRERLTDDSLATIVGRHSGEADQAVGMESRYASTLAPSAGAMTLMRDGRRRAMWVDRAGITPSRAGESLRTSIDLRIQQIVREELERAMIACDAAGARCVVVDPDTGEILAMVDLVAQRDDLIPFDPKNPEHLAPASGQRRRFQIIPPLGDPSLDPAIRRNRLVHDQYEPGSIFKPFVWAAITGAGLVGSDEEFHVGYGKWRTPYGRLINDVVDNFATMDWRQVLVRSSNIGMAQGAARLSREQLRATILAFGFGAPTGLGLPGERAGMVTSARNWNDYTQTSVSFGQEIAVTPVQMVRAFCAFARSGAGTGTLPTLTLLANGEDTRLGSASAVTQASTKNPGKKGLDQKAPGAALKPVIDPMAALLARDAMVEIAANVRRRAKQVDPDMPPSLYSSFGKTGTAQVARPGTRGYFENQYMSSYITAAPADHPRIALLVIVDDPGPARIAQRAHYGSATAGPAALRIIDRVLAYMGVPPDGDAAGEQLAGR
jgi:cell division protein FtsI (penicillin-binding protein 3)